MVAAATRRTNTAGELQRTRRALPAGSGGCRDIAGGSVRRGEYGVRGEMNPLHAIFAGLLAVMMLARVRRAIAITLVAILAAGFVCPPIAQAQIGIGAVLAAVSAVLKTINNLIQGLFNIANSLLAQISAVMGAFRQLMETVVYPQNLINEEIGR